MLRVINRPWIGVELGNSNHPNHRGADGAKVPLMPGSAQHYERSVMHVRGSQASRATLRWNRHASFPYSKHPLLPLPAGTRASILRKTDPDQPLRAHQARSRLKWVRTSETNPSILSLPSSQLPNPSPEFPQIIILERLLPNVGRITANLRFRVPPPSFLNPTEANQITSQVVRHHGFLREMAGGGQQRCQGALKATTRHPPGGIGPMDPGRNECRFKTDKPIPQDERPIPTRLRSCRGPPNLERRRMLFRFASQSGQLLLRFERQAQLQPALSRPQTMQFWRIWQVHVRTAPNENGTPRVDPAGSGRTDTSLWNRAVTKE